MCRLLGSLWQQRPGPLSTACDQQAPHPQDSHTQLCGILASLEFLSPDHSGVASPQGKGLRQMPGYLG